MRATFNTYGHNSNRHLDSKDCKEEIREEEGERKKNGQTQHEEEAAEKFRHYLLIFFFFFCSCHFIRLSVFFIIRFALL